ncbi:MAG: biotin/lipoyl-containing protein [Ilumatobacteraceae bacterium]
MADPCRRRRALPMTQEQVRARQDGRAIESVSTRRPGRGQVPAVARADPKARRPRRLRRPLRLRYESGDEINQYYDNLVGKLIVWGRDRDVAIRRTIRALDELVVEGVATTIPADLAILRHPDFIAVEHSTKWVEQTLDLSGVGAAPAAAPADDEAEPLIERTTTVEVNGKRFAVKMWVPETVGVAAAPAKTKKKRAASGGGGSAAGSGQVAVPMQGTIVKILVEVGQEVTAGQGVVVLEAMKMENQINADKDGTIAEIKVATGDTVGGGDVVVVID